MQKLVIVESPSKAKTIKKYLGKEYEVVASMGHIRDLPKSKIGVDIENDFTPKYINMRDKSKIIKQLREKAAKSEKVLLAADPDREGEAISWHLCHVLKLDTAENNRITFNEITKSGITKGIENPRQIDMDLVNAQQARRILDRIVGYKLSPFLWKKIKSGLSAGRVQSAVLRMIVDRENEIRQFVSEEYWSIDANFIKDRKKFTAKLAKGPDDKKIEIKNESQAKEILESLDNADYIVSSIKKGTRRKQPAPPFITSTLQQDASRKLNFNSYRTMRVAQDLYEGVEIKGIGATGLITYMRTDSLRISQEARNAGTEYIKETFGEKYLPKKPRFYKQKGSAQDAHEAIRPTNPGITPDSIKGSLTADQYKLYKLIWDRFIASLMESCVLNTINVEIKAADYTFKASGHTVKFDGFTVLYEEGKDETEEKQAVLPEMKEGDILKLKELVPNQHFTQPPARYTEASLIKAMEEYGIGRPSTYATVITTIVNRDYVERNKKQLVPTPLGEVVTQLMLEMFNDIVDLKFTAKIETGLDNVATGKEQWVNILKRFYVDFEKSLNSAEEKMSGTKIKVPEIESDVQCEKCGRNMVIKSGRFGKFLACPGYPECKNTKSIVVETPGKCPKCGKRIIERKSSKGNKYYACESGKECGFMTWDVPTKDSCPNCGNSLFKRRGGLIVCLKEECNYQTKATKKSKNGDVNEG